MAETDLPNRLLLYDLLAKAMAFASRHERPLAVGFLDVDGLKAVNDSWGHSVGDRVLSGLAARISAGLRQSDIVGRVGGDEFVIVLSEVARSEDAALVAGKLLQAIAAPYRVGGRDVTVTASLGPATRSFVRAGSAAAVLVGGLAPVDEGEVSCALFSPSAEVIGRANARRWGEPGGYRAQRGRAVRADASGADRAHARADGSTDFGVYCCG